MPAKTKAGLLAVTHKEFETLMAVVEPISEAVALKKRDKETSIKDVIAHRAHWIALFLGWYADGQAGKPVHFPAQGHKWNDLKRYNADLRDTQSDLGWADAVTQVTSSHDALLALLNTLPEDALYGAPMKGAKNNWSIGRWADGPKRPGQAIIDLQANSSGQHCEATRRDSAGCDCAHYMQPANDFAMLRINCG